MSLVCLAGGLPALRHTAASIVEHLLVPLRAEAYAWVPRGDDASLTGLAELRHQLQWKGTEHGSRILHIQLTRKDLVVRRPGGRSRHGATHAANLTMSAAGEDGTTRSIEQGKVSVYVQHERCLRFYRKRGHLLGWLVHTRADFSWSCPHPPLTLLIAGAVWVQRSVLEDHDRGLFAGHWILGLDDAEKLLASWRRFLSDNAVGLLSEPDGILLARLRGAGIVVRHFPLCAYRTWEPGDTVPEAPAMWRLWWKLSCGLGTGAHWAYSWQWAAAESTAACFNSMRGLVDTDNFNHWTADVLWACFQVPVPFPEDIGFVYMSEAAPRQPADTRVCRSTYNNKLRYFITHSGAPLEGSPERHEGEALWPRLLAQRHLCRYRQHTYLYSHIDLRDMLAGVLPNEATTLARQIVASRAFRESESLRAFGMCVPASCRLDVVCGLGVRTALALGADRLDIPTNRSKVAKALKEVPWEMPVCPLTVEDPTTGASLGVAGAAPVWTVPLSAVRGVDFVITGFPGAGADAIHANLAKHHRVAFLEGPPPLPLGRHDMRRHEDSLFALGHAPGMLAQDRQFLLDERSPRRDLLLGLHTVEATLAKKNGAPAARLRALRHHQHGGGLPLKLVVAVRHPLELLEDALNDETNGASGAAAVEVSATAAVATVLASPLAHLPSDTLRVRILPFWPEDELLLVPLEALRTDPRGTMDRVCAFLGVESLPEQDLTPTIRKVSPGGPWALVAPATPQALRDPLREYLAEDAAALRVFAHRFGGLELRADGAGDASVGQASAVSQGLGAAGGVDLGPSSCLGLRLLRCGEGEEDNKAEENRDAERAAGQFLCRGVSDLTSLPTSLEGTEQDPATCRVRFHRARVELTHALERHISSGLFPRLIGPPSVALASSVAQVAKDTTWSQRADNNNLVPDQGILAGEDEHYADILEPDVCFKSAVTPRDRATCLARVRVKDPWGCLRELRPAWARANVWVRCCGGIGFVEASAEVAPCPPMRCCILHGNPVRSGIPDFTARLVDPVPSWLSCTDASSDPRWRVFRALLADPKNTPRSPSVQLLGLAEELVSSKDSPVEQERLRRLMNFNVEGGELDAGFCFVGYAIALYVVACGSRESPKTQEWFRWVLVQLLNIGPSPDVERTMPLAWFVDAAGWPVQVSELVVFALGGRGGPLPRPTPPAPLPPMMPPSFLVALPSCKQEGCQSPKHLRGICLISSHMFALDMAMALSAALGDIAAGSSRTTSVRWYGFPEKFFHHQHGSRDIVQLCALRDPPLNCGGPGAAALDRLLERVTMGRVGDKQRGGASTWRGWPFNVLPDVPGGTMSPRSGVGGIHWRDLVSELGALVYGPLGIIGAGELIVCGYPTVVCLALEVLLATAGAFLVVALSGSTVEYAEPVLQERLRAQLVLLAGRVDRAVVCFSRFDEAHLAEATNLRVPCIHYGARYIFSAMSREEHHQHRGDKHSQRSRQILVSRLKFPLGKVGAELTWMLLQDMTHNRLPYRLVTFEAQYEYSVLGDFRAAVFVPWNWELVTFLEWYALGLPLFVPCTQMVVPLVLHTLIAGPSLHANATTWVNLRREWAHGSLADVAPTRLEDQAAWLANWYARTDYMRAPHVRSFGSFVDLLVQIAGCDFGSWAAALRAANSRAEHLAGRHYASLVERALAVVGGGAVANGVIPT